MKFFHIDELKKTILHKLLIFLGALLLGVGAAVVMQWAQARAEQLKGISAEQAETLRNASPEREVLTKTASVKPLEKQADEKIKKVALTFDDGPNAEYTGLLLDGLKERGVHATFFVLGSEVERYPQLVRRAHEEGHLIGVHAYKHVNLRQLSDAEAMEQVDRTNAAIYRATGTYASYIRPPYGCWKEDLDYEVQMVEVLWDIDPRDWATTSSDLVVQRVLGEVEENSIILLHDASQSSVQAAFAIIDVLQKKDYLFVTVEELLME